MLNGSGDRGAGLLMNWRLLAAVTCVLLATIGCNSQASPPGKFEIATFEVPAEVLEKMAAVKSDTTFSPEWESPLLKLAPEHNPFMVEVDYAGETTGAGRAENIFELVWFGLNGESGGPLQMLRFVQDPAPAGTQACHQNIRAAVELQEGTGIDAKAAAGQTQSDDTATGHCPRALRHERPNLDRADYVFPVFAGRCGDVWAVVEVVQAPVNVRGCAILRSPA